MKAKLTICTILFLLYFQGFSQQNKLHFDRYNTSNGLSNNRVYSIIQDKLGFLWFGTLDGLNRFDAYSFTIYRNIPLDSLSLQNNRILNMYQDSLGYLWLFTKKNGVSRFDPETENFQHYEKIAGADFTLFDIEIDQVKENSRGQLILMAQTKRLRYDRETNHFVFMDADSGNKIQPSPENLSLTQAIRHKYHLETEITDIVDGINFKWIATKRQGLFLLQNGDSVAQVEHYNYPPFDHAEVKCIYKDRTGIIWIGTKNKGVFKHNPFTRNFLHYSNFGQEGLESSETTIRAITDDAQGNLWIGTYNNGLIRFNRKQHKFTRYTHNPKNPHSLPNNMVRTLYTDLNGTVWAGTYAGASRYNPQTNNFTNYLPAHTPEIPSDVNDSTHLFFNRVYGFDNDHFGNLWIANWRGLSCFNPQSGKFKHYPSRFFQVDNIREVYVDKNNSIWIGSEFGGLVQFNALNEKFEHYLPGDKLNTLSHQNVFAIHESADNKLYISTFNGLSVLHRESGKFQRYSNNDGLAGNMIYGILEDSLGHIWLTTTNGLSVLNPETGHITNYTEKIGLQSNEFTEGAYHQSPYTGEMIIGGINGINIFQPNAIRLDTIAPKVSLTALLLFNQAVNLKREDQLLTKVINYTDAITLKHKNKVISFEFTALHFAIPEENHFKYMLEGFDADWVFTGPQRRFATYTNLKPGKYTFKVMAANADNYWSKEAAQLQITILPPLWKTWWAFLLYTALIILLMLLFRYYSIRSTQMKNTLKLERLQHEKTEEMHQMKLNFFTNISHEFRTPLSLIIGPIEDLVRAHHNSTLQEGMHQLKLIQANAQKMIHLTDQIIDLRKLEMGKMHLSATAVNANDFIDTVLAPFQELAHYNSISITKHLPTEPLTLWVDQDKMDKAISNLLSNAIKYTPKNGQIEITLQRFEEGKIEQAVLIGDKPNIPCAMLSVKDNGIGIPQEQLLKIFQQFYRVESDNNRPIQGSGIGLALVKEMLDLHKGTIAVESSSQHGSTFHLILPLGKEHLKPEQLSNEVPHFTPRIQPSPVPTQAESKHIETKPEEIENQKCILLVEDNDELRQYIASFLSRHYRVLQASNGQEGIETAFKQMPDLIISDIMMPKKNGIELCKMLKNDIKTSHILIILLSAKTADEDKIEGYKCKADAYIAKPFNKDLLQVRIQNLLETRESLIESLGDYKNKQKKAQHQLNPLDQEFMQKVNSLVEQNLANAEFNVEQLSEELGMSRSNLHLKLKALTKQSASDYIRTIRLQHAAELLKEQKKNINEIAYEVGFNTPSYFIKCFKEKFGLTPKEYCKI